MSEFDIHRFAVQLLTLKGVKNLIFFHVPNGEQRSKRTGARLKAMGVVRGVSDLVLVIPAEPAPRVVFFEIKDANGRLSVDQRIFRQRAEDAGADFLIAASPDEVEEQLAKCGALRRRPTETERRQMAGAPIAAE